MKAFILIISLGVIGSAAADDGRWYDYKGNQVRPASKEDASKVAQAPTAVVKKEPILGPVLGSSQNLQKQRRWQRSRNGKLYFTPYQWRPHCHWPNDYYQRLPRWSASYRSSRVNILITQ